MKDVFYFTIESSKKDSKTNSKIATTDLIVKKIKDNEYQVLSCLLDGNFEYGKGMLFFADKINGVAEFIWKAIEFFNASPNKPEHVTLSKRIHRIYNWKEEATEDILPDEVLLELGVNPETISRDCKV